MIPAPQVQTCPLSARNSGRGKKLPKLMTFESFGSHLPPPPKHMEKSVFSIKTPSGFRETFGSLTFHLRFCSLFSLGLISHFSTDPATLSHFSMQVVKNVEAKFPLLPSGLALPSSADRPTLCTFAIAVTSALPPPDRKMLRQEQHPRSTEDCTSAGNLRCLTASLRCASRTAAGKSLLLAVPRSLCTHPC